MTYSTQVLIACLVPIVALCVPALIVAVYGFFKFRGEA